MKETAKAPSNIAFIKYWGKKDPELNIPNNTNLSVNMSNLITTTTVEFSKSYPEDDITIDGEKKPEEISRAIKHLGRIRQLAQIDLKAKVVSNNNFPKASGLASSASGFAALTIAGCAAAGLKLSEKELTTIARLGSGSASRSIPDGFVEWVQGHDHNSSYAHSLYPPIYWDVDAIVVLASLDKKEVGSTEGHEAAYSSPFYKTRLDHMDNKVKALKKALADKDFITFGEIIEAEALELHSIALTSKPPIIYWVPVTLTIMKLCQQLRQQGLAAYFTMDAGPQPVVFCQSRDAKNLVLELKKIDSIKQLIINKPAKGARIADKHLF